MKRIAYWNTGMAETEPTRTLSNPQSKMVEVSARAYQDTLGHLRRAAHKAIFGSDSGTGSGFSRSDASSYCGSSCSEPTRACLWSVIVVKVVCRDQASG